MRYHLQIIFFLILLVLPITVFAAVQPGDTMPNFSLTTMKGETIDYANIRGKEPIMLIFWATWCPLCREEVPHLNDLYSKLGPKGMRFIGINVGINDSVAKAERYAQKYKIKYPLFFDEGSLLSKKFRVLGTPTILIVDRHGIIQFRGNAVPDNLEQAFKMLMN